MARSLQPSLVVLEDVDIIAQDRESADTTCRSPLLFDLLNQMDGLAEDTDVIFVLTTNRPQALEPALAARPGRIDLAVEIPLPDADCRRRLLALYGRGLSFKGDDLAPLIARTEGVSAALSAGFNVDSFCIAPVMFVGMSVNRTDRSTAVPMVPPIWRKNVAALVATPMSRGETEFCAASVSVCMSCPSPRPMPNMPSIRNQRGLSAVRKVRSVKPIAVNAVPVTGNAP